MAPTNHDVWDAVEQSEGTPGNSFEFGVAVQANRAGAYVPSFDISNVNPAFSGKTRARQTYAAKGVDLAVTYARNLVVTFDVEVIRDDNGQYQPFLQDLIDASKVLGTANRRRLQVFDALGADYAFQADFSIEVTRTNTGWDDAGWFTITATQYSPAVWITNPVLVGNVPVINAVSPTGAAAAAHIFIQGDNFTGVTGAASVKVGANNATSYVVVDDNLIDAVVPAGSAGETFVRVTSPVGVGQDYPYTRGA